MSSPAEARMTAEEEDHLVRQVLRGEAGDGPKPKMGADQLRRVLHRAQERMDFAHRAATSAWCAPLSLFDEVAQGQATRSGIPDWAIRTVLKARRLVEQAAGLGDLTDVYEAQILTAQKEKRGLARAALLLHLEHLDEAAEELRAHLPYLQAAKKTFDSPIEDSRVKAAHDSESTGGWQASSSQSPRPDKVDDSPVVILQPLQRRSPFLASLRPKEYFIRFLEGAVDLIGAAGTATGMSVDVQDFPELKERQSMNIPTVDLNAVGTVSPWLNAEANIEPPLARLSQEVDWSSAQVVWERCRRKTDRRWTLA
mmetsp:Transcript_33070/g.74357  ORF Transcript_33070/g.74357 Transcript_33070/m.74357 type:complete len:311 (+) Transcript_33070:82-1014(+)